jgi:hypothetical protein
MTAIGIRMLQAVGANRKIVYGQRPNASDELWKRAFWLVLVLLSLTKSVDVSM